MTVLVQPMPWLRTAAFSIAIRAGVDVEPRSLGGLSGLTCEMVQRGAGKHSSRDLVAIQDNLGMDRSSGVSVSTSNFGASMPAESLKDAIELYAQIVQNPHLPEDQLEDARMMSLQEIRANQDEPTHRVMQTLRQMHWPPCLDDHPMEPRKESRGLQSDVREFFESHYHAGESIMAIAGNVDATLACQWVEDSFGQWHSKPVTDQEAASGGGYEHIHSDSSQTHIGFAYRTIPYGHPDYFRMRAGIGILSDGMSSRLFDRVREQQGLCYTVTASCHSLSRTPVFLGTQERLRKGSANP